MKQRLGIGIALLGDPEFLILDEPVNGLDPTGIKEIRDVILRLNHERGITFLISSHLLNELAKIVTTYGIINYGVLIEQISAAELEHRCLLYRRNDYLGCRRCDVRFCTGQDTAVPACDHSCLRIAVLCAKLYSSENRRCHRLVYCIAYGTHRRAESCRHCAGRA